ncbi:MAG: oligosaccharide flippase family protein [Saprospirales bacterium]|nr:oligosaccharide flippase family protein [Saprospirales bacterium]
MSGLKTRAIQSVKWNTLSMGVTTLLQIVQMVWLARLLDPADFGLMAMVWVVLRLTNPLTQGGLSQAIVRNSLLSRIQFSTLFWLQIGIGVILFLIILVGSPLLGLFFRVPGLPYYLVIASFSLLINPFGSTIQAIFTQTLEFKKLAWVQIGGQIAEFTLAVILAYWGAGVLALVWGGLARSVVSTILTWAHGWKDHTPLWTFHWKEIRTFLTFAAFETGSLTINSLSTQIDKAIIGRLLGPHILGLYTIAWELIVLPTGRINPILMRVAYPVFSKIQGKLKN